MPLISARSAQDWAEKLAAECDESVDLVLREILAAVDCREVLARNSDDHDESWRIALPAMIENIDRKRRGHTDPDHVLGPGILVFARRILIDASELDRWRAARSIERGDRSTVAQPAGTAEILTKRERPTAAQPEQLIENRRPGPKAGEKSAKDLASEIALRILPNEERQPKLRYGRPTQIRYGRRKEIARLVNVELTKSGHKYADDSVRKMIAPTLREWETKNPDG